MKVLKNNVSSIPLIETNVDSDKDLKYIPKAPLSKRASMYISGAPGSGKSSLWCAVLRSKPTKSKPKDKRYYNNFFDRVETISNSMSTIPIDKFKLPGNQLHDSYSDEILLNIIGAHMRARAGAE